MEQQPARISKLPDELSDVLVQSVQLGTAAGACGMLFGAASGIIRGVKTPVLFSLVAGFQWFGLSSVFYGTRKLVIARHGPEYTVTPAQKVGASAIAGATSVLPVGLLLRGPRNILPGAIIFSLLGAGGQFISNRWSSSETSEKKPSWFNSKWSPITRLTDEQYRCMLEEKILRIETEIAILDENKAALMAEEKSNAEPRKDS